MVGAGHSVAALSLYLGLKESEVRERVAALDLPAASEKPLRRPVSANPWSVEEVRRLIALWLDNVSVMSIAGALGRTPSSIRGKRRWLGLGVRLRKDLAHRAVAQCRATPLPWKPTLDIKPILSRLWAPRIGKGAGTGSARRLSQRSNGSWGAMLGRMIGFPPSDLRGSAPGQSPNGC